MIASGVSVKVQHVHLFPSTDTAFVTLLDLENKAINAKGHPEDIISTIRFDDNAFEQSDKLRLLKDHINLSFILTDIKRDPRKYQGLAMCSPFNCVLGKYFGEFEAGLEELFELSDILSYEVARTERDKLILDLFGIGPKWDMHQAVIHPSEWVAEAERVLNKLKGL